MTSSEKDVITHGSGASFDRTTWSVVERSVADIVVLTTCPAEERLQALEQLVCHAERCHLSTNYVACTNRLSQGARAQDCEVHSEGLRTTLGVILQSFSMEWTGFDVVDHFDADSNGCHTGR